MNNAAERLLLTIVGVSLGLYWLVDVAEPLLAAPKPEPTWRGAFIPSNSGQNPAPAVVRWEVRECNAEEVARLAKEGWEPYAVVGSPGGWNRSYFLRRRLAAS